jgi:hypothetical protein
MPRSKLGQILTEQRVSKQVPKQQMSFLAVNAIQCTRLLDQKKQQVAVLLELHFAASGVSAPVEGDSIHDDV